MKKLTFLACMVLLLGNPPGLSASDPFDIGQQHMSCAEALLNIGIYALTHPDGVKEALQGQQPEPKTKDELTMDKKVDDAIKKAWEKQ